jgi:nitroreductase
MSQLPTFHDVVRARRSSRAFLPTPVPDALLAAVLDDARLAPSNCNTQPWEVHIASGATRDRLSQAMIHAFDTGRRSLDFTFDGECYPGVYGERRAEQGRSYYAAVGVARDSPDERRAVALRNLEFFGAPHVALLFMPPIGDCVRTAADVGMYGQTLLLSLVAHGLAGIPQTFLGFFADTARTVLGVDSGAKLLFGISFGYPDEIAPSAAFRIGRAAIAETVKFHG